MEKTFIKIRSNKDSIISASLVLVGIIFTILPVNSTINIAGISLALIGMIIAFILKSGYKDSETGEKYLKKEYYFQHAMKLPLSAVIASKPESIDISEKGEGNTLRLDIYFSKSANKAYIQLFEYIPYQYEPCSEMYEYEITEVENLIK